MLGLGSSLIRGSFTEAFTPLTISGLSLWLQNGEGVAVDQWDDSSGNDNHIVQGTADVQAAVVDGGLDFEGTEGDFYTLSSDIAIAEQGNFSIFMVINIESFADGGAQNTLLGTGETATFFEFQNNKRIRIKTGEGTDIIEFPTNTFATGSKMLIHVKRAAGTQGPISVQKNGSTVTASSNPSGDGNNTGAITFDRIGARNNDRYFDGIIYELLFYGGSSLLTEEIDNVNNFLIAKHGL